MAEIDEFDLAGPSAVARTPTSARRPSQQPWFWGICAIALVVLGAATAPTDPLLLGVGTEQGDPVGVLDVDLAVPPQVLWGTTLEAVEPTGWPMLQRVGDVAIVLGDPTTGLDITTGEPLWAIPTTASTCSVTRLVVCTPTSGDGTVTVLDPATGTTETVQVDAAVHATAVDDGLVVAVDVGKGRLVKVDTTGAIAWDVPVDAAVVETDEPYPWLQAATVDGILVVSAPLPYAVDLGTGEAQSRPDQWNIWVSPYGVVVDRVVEGEQVRYQVDHDGAVTATPGSGSAVRVDDGRGADVQLRMEGQQLNAATADGLDLWTIPENPVSPTAFYAVFPLARLEGVVVAAAYGDDVLVGGYDLLHGSELWRLPDGSWPEILAGADSTLLWLSNASTLGALDVHGGEQLWSEHLAGTVLGTAATEDGLLVLTSDSLVRLAWAAEQ